MAKGMWWGPQSRLRKKKLRFKNQYKDQYENPNAPYNVSFGINPILTPKPILPFQPSNYFFYQTKEHEE